MRYWPSEFLHHFGHLCHHFSSVSVYSHFRRVTAAGVSVEPATSRFRVVNQERWGSETKISSETNKRNPQRGGGFKYKIGEDFQFDEHIFQMGWFNHQLAKQFDNYPKKSTLASWGVCRTLGFLFQKTN